MESKSLEEKKRYLNYLIILNSDIRKVYIVETRVIPGDKNDIIKLIKSDLVTFISIKFVILLAILHI